MNHLRDIVVVGASPGGVTALAGIVRGWPADFPASVLVAMSTPEQPAPMVLQILASYAPMKVSFATDGDRVGPGRIYLAPFDAHLTVGSGGVLQVDRGHAFEGPRPSINLLFAAAARVYGRRVIGIVLSGNSTDGAQGLLEIEAAGGVGIVQEPGDAMDPRMPRNAIQHDSPQYRAKASEIAALVQKVAKGR